MTASPFLPGRRALLAASAGLLAMPRRSHAATWPEAQVTIVAPFTAGGPVDVLARAVAMGIQAATSQTVIVDNRVGAQGNIGIDFARRAKPDGNTLLIVPAGNLTINPTLMSNLPYDVERDFAPISLLATAPNVIVCPASLPVRNFQELLAFAKQQTDGVTYASPGVGSQLHLAGELLAQKAGISMLHVPYKGSSHAVADAISGQVQLLFSNLPAVLSAIQGGQLRALALTTATRSETAPEIPTLAEEGIEGIDITSWYGLLAPKQTPQPVQAAIFERIRAVLHAPDTLQMLKAQGLALVEESQADFAQRIRQETATWAEVIRERHIEAGL
ncbi:hypothetical protein HMPREF9946_02026 [Acetobacteraceae bacterium AT-5844]|nr:hypothetical protein HMPREF9946_02026 [Acetobacteraceae bacterium AT-5844]